MRLDPAKRMQTVPELMSALTDPNVANAMFERGDNQISTRKIMAVSLVVIFVLVVLLLWSLAGGSRDGGTPSATPQPTAAAAAGENTEATTVPNLVGLRYTTDIKGNDATADSASSWSSRAPTPCRRALSSVRTRLRARKS